MTISLDQMQPDQFEEWLDFGLDRFHESWRESWGKTITSPDLRDAISETSRLAMRLKENILQEVKETILPNRDKDNGFPTTDMGPVKQFIDKARPSFIRRVGLVWRANTLKNLLNGASSHELLDALGHDTIREALAMQMHAPVLTDSIDVPSIKKVLEQDGLRCCLDWVRQFPNFAALRLAVLLPKPGKDVQIADEIDERRVHVVNVVLSPEEFQ